jgi:hypothetical protein
MLTGFFSGCSEDASNTDAVKDSQTKEKPTKVDSNITVSPSKIAVSKGQSQQFTVTNTNDKNGGGTFTWTIIENTVPGTTVSEDGLLKVAADETAEALTVKASKDGKYGTANVTVSTAVGTNDSKPGVTDGRTWEQILTEIAKNKKHVELDLSGWDMNGMNGTEFDPGTYDTGKNLITSLILPDAAKSIKAGHIDTEQLSKIDYAFRYFSNLESITGNNIETVGDYAFCRNASLTTVNFPKAKTIGRQAFFKCSALITVNLPKVKSVGEEAFFQCKLTTLDLPSAEYIGVSAFDNCGKLTTLNLPQAIEIGDKAFALCSNLATLNLPRAASIGSEIFDSPSSTPLTITLGDVPPSVGKNIFANASQQKNVTIKRPSLSAKIYVPATNGPDAQNWSNAFLGLGWSRSPEKYYDGTISDKINLTFADSD